MQYNSLGTIDEIRSFDGEVAIKGEYGGWVLFDPTEKGDEIIEAIGQCQS